MTRGSPNVRPFSPGKREYDAFEQALLNDWQHELPLTERPFAVMAEKLGVTEDAVIEALQALQHEGVVSRVGATIKPGSVGAGTLAAMSVPEDDLERVAALISARPEVNHNYEREHDFNLWFVATAADEKHLNEALALMEQETGYPLLDLRLMYDYHLDLGFDIQWSPNATKI